MRFVPFVPVHSSGIVAIFVPVVFVVWVLLAAGGDVAFGLRDGLFAFEVEEEVGLLFFFCLSDDPVPFVVFTVSGGCGEFGCGLFGEVSVLDAG